LFRTTNKLAGTYSLVFLSNTSKPTIDFANSMIEWMSDATQKIFDNTRSHPFSFEYVVNSLQIPELSFVMRCVKHRLCVALRAFALP
jgi:hypothetical protein